MLHAMGVREIPEFPASAPLAFLPQAAAQAMLQQQVEQEQAVLQVGRQAAPSPFFLLLSSPPCGSPVVRGGFASSCEPHRPS